MKTIVALLIVVLINFTSYAQELATTKKNVVFIHGAWSTGEVWNNYKTHFLEKGYTCYTPTFRYHSQKQNDSLIGVSMEDYIDEIRGIVNSLASPPTIIAHSMGCIIAQRLAMEGLLIKMILIAAPF